MAKNISEQRMVIIFSLEKQGAEISVNCRADYTVTSDDLEVTRSLEPSLTTAQKDMVKTFGANILSQIKSSEGVV